MTTNFQITPQGPFSLRESALFGFGHRHETVFDGVMRLAFVRDDFGGQVGVALRQDDPDGPVDGVTVGARAADIAAVRQQVARVLSLDHDARGFLALARHDPVLGRLQRAAPGLRPPLFYSPYEAAVWAILSARRAARQAAVLRDRLGREFGRTVTVAGQELAALPTPTELLAVDALPGLPPPRVGWLHGIAQAALDGRLDPVAIAAADPDDAVRGLRRLDGIGPFYAALIVVRATGAADVLPTNEPRVLAVAGELYGDGRPLTPEQLTAIAEKWRPWRTWACVYLRAVAHRP